MNNILNLLAHCAHNRHAALKNSGHAVLDAVSPNSMGIAGQARNDVGAGL